jgi:predicted transcriptional regulator
MKFGNPYWSIKLKISTLQRWILVNSILYYELGENIVEDRVFDNNARQLEAMQKEYLEEAKKSQYWYAFYDFDANTGFHLYSRLTDKDKAWHMMIAHTVLKQFKGGKR